MIIRVLCFSIFIGVIRLIERYKVKNILFILMLLFISCDENNFTNENLCLEDYSNSFLLNQTPPIALQDKESSHSGSIEDIDSSTKMNAFILDESLIIEINQDINKKGNVEIYLKLNIKDIIETSEQILFEAGQNEICSETSQKNCGHITEVTSDFGDTTSANPIIGGSLFILECPNELSDQISFKFEDVIFRYGTGRPEQTNAVFNGYISLKLNLSNENFICSGPRICL